MRPSRNITKRIVKVFRPGSARPGTVAVLLSALLLAISLAVPVAARQDRPQAPGAGNPSGASQPATGKENLQGRSTMSREQGSSRGQQGAGATDEAGQRGLRDQDIQATQLGQPTQQGTRPPEVQRTEATDALFMALAAVRNAPPDLNGTPVPRPNPYGSEPEVDADPSRSPNPSEQTSREIK